MPLRFVFFDLGNVLLSFSHERMVQQLAAAYQVPYEPMYRVVMQQGLQTQYELGQLDTQAFYDSLCKHFSCQPDLDQVMQAAGDIFSLKFEMVPIAANLRSAGYKLGILSNTCPAHWQWIQNSRINVVKQLFDVCTLSFEVGVMKPEPQIYRAAAEQAGVPPHEIFYTDDLPENVTGALRVGFDAVLFQSAPQLASELALRGVRFNY